MCHLPAQGFTVNETRLAVGINGKTTKRNPPTLYNVAYQRLLFHDGREFTLEDQMISPLTNPVEMGNPSIGYVINKIRKLPGYEEQFHRVFGEEVSVRRWGKQSPVTSAPYFPVTRPSTAGILAEITPLLGRRQTGLQDFLRQRAMQYLPHRQQGIRLIHQPRFSQHWRRPVAAYSPKRRLMLTLAVDSQ